MASLAKIKRIAKKKADQASSEVRGEILGTVTDVELDTIGEIQKMLKGTHDTSALNNLVKVSAKDSNGIHTIADGNETLLLDKTNLPAAAVLKASGGGLEDKNGTTITLAETLTADDLPNVTASKINDGTLDTARIPALPYAGQWTNSEVAFGAASINGSGTGTVKARQFGNIGVTDHTNITSERTLFLKAGNHANFTSSTIQMQSDISFENSTATFTRSGGNMTFGGAWTFPSSVLNSNVNVNSVLGTANTFSLAQTFSVGTTFNDTASFNKVGVGLQIGAYTGVSGALQVTANASAGDGAAFKAFINSNHIINFVNAAGSIRGKIKPGNPQGSSVQYASTSDGRLKENAQPLTGQLEKIMSVNACSFMWKEEQEMGQGFIAQEIYRIWPEMREKFEDTYCSKNEDFDPECPCDETGKPHYYALDYGSFTPFIISAFQENKKIVDSKFIDVANTAENNLSELKQDIAQLKATHVAEKLLLHAQADALESEIAAVRRENESILNENATLRGANAALHEQQQTLIAQHQTLIDQQTTLIEQDASNEQRLAKMERTSNTLLLHQLRVVADRVADLEKKCAPNVNE